MIALNAATEKHDPGFGMGNPFAGVPIIYKNLIFVDMNLFGSGEEHLHYRDEAPGGPSRRFPCLRCARWQEAVGISRHSSSRREGHDDWEGDSWKGRTRNNMWFYSMSVDEQRGIVYMPAANYYGGDRKANSMFANSVVAVDANTIS